ncbi:FkbM family methyltransferase [Anderseniella sp. Alg231-50]|uniref:FkbM family methyltransferase n=1 Tax=Anderseniella sp. Alg231-50 TaxID=1922226 RepID=UPI000D5614F3
MRDDDGDLIARHVDDVMRHLKALYDALPGNPDHRSKASRFVADTADRPAPEPPFAMHDADYRVFRHFTDDSDLIVDIGANCGYSAESIWASGSGARVLSFEALNLHDPNLATLKKVYGDRFDYRIMGLGNSSAILEFVTPVVNGIAITALATAWNDIHWQSLAENTIRFGDIEAYRSHRPVDIDLALIQAPVMKLDDALKSQGLNLQGNNICAIKIDVEGLEPEVVAGARETLLHHKPLLLIEAAQFRTEMLKVLQDMGYRFATRNGDVLEPVLKLPTGVNSFFWHADQQTHYETLGLLARKRSTAASLLRNWLKLASGR